MNNPFLAKDFNKESHACRVHFLSRCVLPDVFFQRNSLEMLALMLCAVDVPYVLIFDVILFFPTRTDLPERRAAFLREQGGHEAPIHSPPLNA